MIVKHENRIRALEAQMKERDEENNIKESNVKQEATTTPSRANLAPDEV